MQAHQESARPHPAGRAGGAAALFPETGAGIAFGGLPGRKYAEQQRRTKCRGQGEGQHQRVGGETHLKTRVRFRHHPRQCAVKEVGCGEAGHASHGAESQTFGDELADKAAAARTERQAQGDFGLARCAAREQKVSQIRTRDQQQHADRRQQRGKRTGEFRARLLRSACARLNFETLIQKFAPAFLRRDRAVERFQASLKDRVGPLGCILSGTHRSGCCPLVFPVKPGTDDGQRNFVHRDGLAQRVGTTADPALPVVVTNDGVGRLDAVLGRRNTLPMAALTPRA